MLLFKFLSIHVVLPPPSDVEVDSTQSDAITVAWNEVTSASEYLV